MLIKQLRNHYAINHPLQKLLTHLETPETYSGLSKWNSIDSIFKLYCIPSFEAYKAWLLQKHTSKTKDKTTSHPISPTTYYVRRITIDFNKIMAYGADAKLPSAEIEPLLTELQNISIKPFIEPKMVGMDGTSYGIDYGNFWQASHLYWWSSHNGWEEINRWYQKAINLFEQYLPQASI